jgi:hypothetical protein
MIIKSDLGKKPGPKEPYRQFLNPVEEQCCHLQEVEKNFPLIKNIFHSGR